MRILLFLIFILTSFWSEPSFAAYQATSVKLNISAINQTIKDPNYFNNLFNTDDFVVTQVPDGVPPTPDQIAQQQVQQEQQQQQAQLIAQDEQAIAIADLQTKGIIDTPTATTLNANLKVLNTANSSISVKSGNLTSQVNSVTP